MTPDSPVDEPSEVPNESQRVTTSYLEKTSLSRLMETWEEPEND